MLQGPTAALPQPWICGDFSVVPDTGHDRSPAPAIDSPTARRDATSTAHLAHLLHEYVDAYRCLHLTAPAYTFHNANCHARLDRVYLPASIIQHMQEACVHFTPHGDHHALDIRVWPVAGVTTSRPDRSHCRIPAGLPLDWLAAPMLMAWAQDAVTYGLTLPHYDLISWWPRMQLCYKRVACSAQAMQAQQLRDATAATIAQCVALANAARTALETAMLAITSSTYAPHLAALQRELRERDASRGTQLTLLRSRQLTAHALIGSAKTSAPPLC